MVSPLRALIHTNRKRSGGVSKRSRPEEDPGFDLKIREEKGVDSDLAVAARVLDSFVLQARVRLSNDDLTIEVCEQGKTDPCLRVRDRFENDIGWLEADIRFFPRRPGTFATAPIDGRRAYSWVSDNSGVAVFDRGFRVLPYGLAEGRLAPTASRCRAQ